MAHNFLGDWQMLYKEIGLGFLLAGFVGPAPQQLLLRAVHHHAPAPLPAIENAIVGPIVAVLSFVCSIGNVPLAAVLWSGGIGFAGVLAFLFADLIVLPILVIYRKYYGGGFTLRIIGADVRDDGHRGLVVAAAFGAAGLIPTGPRPTPGRRLRRRSASTTSCGSTCSASPCSRRCSGSPCVAAPRDPVCGMRVDRGHAVRGDGRRRDGPLLLGALPPRLRGGARIGGARVVSEPRHARLCSALTAATVVVASGDLALAVTGRSRPRRVTKSLLMPLVAARLIAGSGPARRDLRDHTLAALALSMAGDATILGESAPALAGGAAWFGLAQLSYLHGFRAAGSRPTVAGVAPIAAAAVAGIGGYWPHAGRLRPVLAGYPPLLAAMAMAASGLSAGVPAEAAGRVVAGSRVFLASDTIVGAQRFLARSPRQRAALEIPAMVTYVAAQWLIADGVARATRG